MCDTQVMKRDGFTYFAKNSDREPGEAQLVVRFPAVQNHSQKKLKATYIEIDQVSNRYGTILSKPFWIWGAEIGANDQGVVIGNEAIFSKVIEKEPGLIGMDLLRLGLERGSSADQALQIITELLQTHGQGGICGYRDKKFRYDNSFIIADADKVWILETAGRHWVAKEVSSVGAISNCMTIGEDFDLKSEGIEAFAKAKGLFSGKGDFNFKKTFDTWFLPFFGGAHHRLSSSQTCLDSVDKNQSNGLSRMMANLRTHQLPSSPPVKGSNRDVCMHAASYIRRSQTCGSQVSRLSKNENLHFFTGSSAPCLSLFKPVSFDETLSFGVLSSDDQTVENSPWMEHEQIHRRLLLDWKKSIPMIESRDQVEEEIVSMFADNPPESYHTVYEQADQLARDWTQRWHEEFKNQPFRYSMMSPYSWYWKAMNRKDGFG
jgi:secernin